MATQGVPYMLSRYLEELPSPPSDTEIGSVSSGSLSTTGSDLLEVFNRVALQRDVARRDLSFAMETIDQLRAHVSGMNHLLTSVQRQLETRRPSNPSLEPPVEVKWTEIWIANTWVCVPPSLQPLLGEAEDQWKRGNSQKTLNMVSHRLNSQGLDFQSEMMCRLLISAVLHISDKSGESMQFADAVLKACDEEVQRDPILATEIGAIAHFLRGKNFMSTGNWVQAYWAFARATSNSRYKAKALYLKGVAADLFPDEGSIPCISPIPPLFFDRPTMHPVASAASSVYSSVQL
ncbi:hypothetical protein FQN54_009910 [Arachnomyces sp. PD_36]|nr:hypothetical protein FQN54_009910 [Arachnomyces sp. PD_36]